MRKKFSSGSGMQSFERVLNGALLSMKVAAMTSVVGRGLFA